MTPGVGEWGDDLMVERVSADHRHRPTTPHLTEIQGVRETRRYRSVVTTTALKG